jgi:hypothetical protein
MYLHYACLNIPSALNLCLTTLVTRPSHSVRPRYAGIVSIERPLCRNYDSALFPSSWYLSSVLT